MSQELRASIQRSYVETLQRLDGALTAICGEFDPLRYSKVISRGCHMAMILRGCHVAMMSRPNIWAEGYTP